MGDRLTIPFNMEGAAIRDPEPQDPPDPSPPPTAVSYPEPRVKYIKGWKSVANGGAGDPGDATMVECGAGTLFPMQVTPAQLAEMCYRVADSRFDAGPALTCELPGIPGTVSGIGISVSDPEVDHEFYTTYGPIGGIPEHTIDVKRSYWIDGANETGEQQIWNSATVAPPYIEFDETTDTFSGFQGEAQCGLRNKLATDYQQPVAKLSADDGLYYHAYTYFSPDPGPDFGSAFGSYAIVSFSGRVAFVDNDGSGNPFSPANELWVGLYCYAGWGDSLGIVYLYASSYAGFDLGLTGTVDDIGYTLDIVLSTTTVTCPIYHYSSTGFYGGTPINSGGPNLVLRATKWLPYKRLDGEPQFDQNTGEWLPDGTPFLDFSNPSNSMYHPPL